MKKRLKLKLTFENLILHFILLYIRIIHTTPKITKLKKENLNFLATKNFESRDSFVYVSSINLISHPHYYNDHGFNLDNEDPFGIRYYTENEKSIDEKVRISAGKLSDVGKQQIKDIAKLINQEMQTLSYYMDVNSNSNNKKSQSFFSNGDFLNVAVRLKRSIESAYLLNDELAKLNEIKHNNHNVWKFDLNYLNYSLPNTSGNKLDGNIFYKVINEIEAKKKVIKKSPYDKLQNLTKDDLFSFYIPSYYEETNFPLNFRFENCNKQDSNFQMISHSKEIQSVFKKEYGDYTNLLKSLVKHKQFEKIKFSNTHNYLRFSDEILENSIEANTILTEYLLSFDFVNSYNKNELKVDYSSHTEKFKIDKGILNEKFNLNELKNFNLFYVKNYSNDFTKFLTSSIFQLLHQIIYSKLSTAKCDLNSKIKLFNFFMHDYNIAAFYKTLINVTPNKLPSITYGSKLSIQILMEKQIASSIDFFVEHGQETINKIIEYVYVKISFDSKILEILKLSQFLEKINSSVIENVESFYKNFCGSE